MKNIELMNASAGSGKTFNLTARVVDAMRSGVAPESVMATTFTNRAAAELRERIRLQLMKSNQPEEANRINDGFIGGYMSKLGIQIQFIGFFPVKIPGRVIAFYFTGKFCFELFSVKPGDHFAAAYTVLKAFP